MAEGIAAAAARIAILNQAQHHYILYDIYCLMLCNIELLSSLGPRSAACHITQISRPPIERKRRKTLSTVCSRSPDE
jgi:hypothetical protein